MRAAENRPEEPKLGGLGGLGNLVISRYREVSISRVV
jgi:hypothetical protein